jgi:hypothetical protein
MISFLSILAVRFFLRMRHASDPDHVIAVTTIVSNQRNSLGRQIPEQPRFDLRANRFEHVES